MKDSIWFWISSLVLLVCISYYGRTEGHCPPILFEDVLLAVKASYAAYKDAELVKGKPMRDTSLKIDTVEQQILKGQKITGFVASNNTHIIIAFRGTKTNKQLFQELISGLQPQLGDEIAGRKVKFFRYFKKAYDVLDKKKLLPTYDPSKKYIITGHSLGGALASIFALDQSKIFGPGKNSYLITFGQPRVGDKAWASAHDEIIPVDKKLRVADSRDVVPAIPRMGDERKKNFRHHSKEVYMMDDKIKVCEDGDNPDGCESHFSPNSLYRHGISYYQAKLENNTKWVDERGFEGATFEKVQCSGRAHTK